MSAADVAFRLTAGFLGVATVVTGVNLAYTVFKGAHKSPLQRLPAAKQNSFIILGRTMDLAIRMRPPLCSAHLRGCRSRSWAQDCHSKRRHRYDRAVRAALAPTPWKDQQQDARWLLLEIEGRHRTLIGMARHYCPNDWSREEFAKRLQDLLELAPTLLPGNSSAHRGPDQMPSTPGQELTDKQLAKLLQKDPGEVAQQLLFLKGALLPAADLGLIIEWQPQLLLLEHNAALDAHLASLQQTFFSQQEDPQRALAAFLSRHPVFLYAEEVSKALRALQWRMKVDVEAGDSMRGKISDNPDLLVSGLRQHHLMPVSNMTHGNLPADWWTNLE